MTGVPAVLGWVKVTMVRETNRLLKDIGKVITEAAVNVGNTANKAASDVSNEAGRAANSAKKALGL